METWTGTIIGTILLLVAVFFAPRYFRYLAKLKKEVEDEDQKKKK